MAAIPFVPERTMLEDGLGSNVAPEEILPAHEVSKLQRGRGAVPVYMRREHLDLVHGQHMAMRMAIEAETLGQFQRLPGMGSSLLGLRVVLGEDEDISFDDILDLPEHRVSDVALPVHTAMERKLHI